jgi:hypothetical protein
VKLQHLLKPIREKPGEAEMPHLQQKFLEEENFLKRSIKAVFF